MVYFPWFTKHFIILQLIKSGTFGMNCFLTFTPLSFFNFEPGYIIFAGLGNFQDILGTLFNKVGQSLNILTGSM